MVRKQDGTEQGQDVSNDKYNTIKSTSEAANMDRSGSTNNPPSYSSSNLTTRNEIPQPGSAYIMRSISSGHIVALDRGEIIYAQEPNPGLNAVWECFKEGDWYGFRNRVSYKLLGRNAQWNLCCTAGKHQEWEKFMLKRKPGGGWIMYGPDWGKEYPIGIKDVNGVDRLIMMDLRAEGVAWEFVKA